MPRYFVELAYMGSNYSGFQKQNNAITIQFEVEKAFRIYLRRDVDLTGSSRTDAGVHAFQNFFHFDIEVEFNENELEKTSYHLNAILPGDIVVKRVFKVQNRAHCRFNAVSRSYIYKLYRFKNPFLSDRAFYYPYHLNIDLLNQAAGLLFNYTDFQSFSKKNTQVFTYNCSIIKSEWKVDANNIITYEVEGNRFLRGMVRGLVGTMLKVGRGKISLDTFKEIVEQQNSSKTDFSTPSHGLTLEAVNFNFAEILF